MPCWGIYNRLMRRVFGVTWRKTRGIGEYVLPRPMEANAIWEYLLPAEDDVMAAEPTFRSREELTPSLRERFESVFEEERRRWNRDHLIVKLPRLSRAVTVLDELFEQPRFVHLVRDGRAVACSLASKFERRGMTRRRALLSAASHWKSVVTFLERTVPGTVDAENLLTLKLEDVQSHPEQKLRALLEFAGLDRSRYPSVPDLRENTNRKWKQRSEPSELKQIEQALAPLLGELGYSDQWS